MTEDLYCRYCEHSGTLHHGNVLYLVGAFSFDEPEGAKHMRASRAPRYVIRDGQGVTQGTGGFFICCDTCGATADNGDTNYSGETHVL